MLEIGSLVDGKYKVLRVVGKGGMSVVYQAVNEKANKIWAIKEVRKDGVQNFEVVKQNLIVETELLKRFNHPNLPSIIDVIDTADSFLIVMDYIEGNSLNKALEATGAQSQEDVIEWSKQLCDVLGYLHSRKPPIIYRDMKPANVMLKPDGNVSLIDFGTAREFKSSSVEDTTCLGTQGYAAPEQYGGQGQTDARTDIYCLGATMYHLVTGHNPSTPPYEMYPIRQWNPMLSSGLEEIIIKCTQRNPNDRYQSCAEVLYALDHYQDLDIENKKVQNLKWKTFLVSVIITIVMILGAVGFKIGHNATVKSTYNSLIEEAQKQTDVASAISMYEEAIDLESSKIDAYNGILDKYMEDGVLTESEYSYINKKVDEKELISNDKAAYASFARELADNLFFCSDNKCITYAANWYKRVVDNTDSSAESTYASNLKILAEHYHKGDIGKVDNMGNQGISYVDYFVMIRNMIDSEFISSNSNIIISSKCYAWAASELYSKNNSFSEANISKEEYFALIDNISSKIAALEATEMYNKNSDNINLVDSVESAKSALFGARSTYK